MRASIEAKTARAVFCATLARFCTGWLLAIHLTGILFSATASEEKKPSPEAPPTQDQPETDSPPPAQSPSSEKSTSDDSSNSKPDVPPAPSQPVEPENPPPPTVTEQPAVPPGDAPPREPSPVPVEDERFDNRGGRGLMNFHDTFPLAILHLQLPVNALHDFDQGDVVMHAAFDWGDSFGLQPTTLTLPNIFTVDSEVHRLELSFWYALHDALYLGTELALQSRSGGVLDGFIDGFHDAFGFGDGGRELVARDQYDLVFQDDGPRSLKRGVGFGDIVLKAHANIYDGDRFLPALALQGLVSLPASTSGFGSDGVDLGVNLALAKTVVEGLHIHGSGGAVYFTDPDVADLDYEHTTFQFVGGLELELGSEVSLVAHFQYQSALMKEARPLDEGRFYVGGGLKWEIVPDTIVELGLLENLSPFKNTTDVSLLLAIEFKL